MRQAASAAAVNRVVFFMVISFQFVDLIVFATPVCCQALKLTKWLQETRKMRFEEVYGGWQDWNLTQEEAVRFMGVCE